MKRKEVNREGKRAEDGARTSTWEEQILSFQPPPWREPNSALKKSDRLLVSLVTIRRPFTLPWSVLLSPILTVRGASKLSIFILKWASLFVCVRVFSSISDACLLQSKLLCTKVKAVTLEGIIVQKLMNFRGND